MRQNYKGNTLSSVDIHTLRVNTGLSATHSIDIPGSYQYHGIDLISFDITRHGLLSPRPKIVAIKIQA